MNTETYRFKIGAFGCTAISDGTFTYAPPTFPPPPVFLLANAPREHLGQALGEHRIQPEKWAEWVSPYICVVLDTGKQRVLVDTGADGLGPDTGRLLRNLQAAGIAPGDIDTVVLTHGHPDHIGGNTDSKGKPAFSRARHIMWKGEWDFWTSGQAEAELDEHVKALLLEFARKSLPPIQGQLDLVDHETEIVPGISVVAAPGHTPGHMAVAVSSEGQQLLCTSDAVLHPVQIEHPEWHAVVDLEPAKLVDTRHRLLNWAETEKALVLAFHFPFPGLGHVVQRGERWQWRPVGATSVT